jgi:mannobiose 2-epimerase
MEQHNTLKKELQELYSFASHELENILNYWIKNAIDNKNGGFIGRISIDQDVDYNANKGLILNARLLWTFSVAYQILKRDELLNIANRAYDYIIQHFADKKNGGYYWQLTNNGKPQDTKKQIYAQAFTLYGFSEYYHITKNEECLKYAYEIFDLIEKYSFDRNKNGYFEAFTEDWREIIDQRLSVKDMNEKKTMNTHLHVIEAYAAFYKVTGNVKVKERVLNLLDVFNNYIINQTDYHFDLFFDENWNCKSNVISYGHDIEGSWLLHESAEIAGDKNYIEKMKNIAVKMANAAIEGVNKDGGLLHDRIRNEPVEEELEWWPQAEALVGYINAYFICKDEKFIAAAIKQKTFIENYFIDKKYGEWFYRIDKNYNPIKEYDKVGFWKCPYHNARMCMELVRRLQ